MNKNRVKGAANKAAGQVKETTGKLAGDNSLRAKGAVQKATGSVQNAAGKVQDKMDGSARRP
ncbi:MAG TPA: CsbD family protein [Caulobacteraceae bacterium]|jgi:uncharacterized protein YjbJ (UPF0337 family)